MIERKTKSAEEIEVHMPGLSDQVLANSKSSINAGQAVKQSTFKSPMEFVEHLWPIAKQIGEEMDYHGRRAMFYLDQKSFLLNLTDQIKSLYEIIYADMKEQVFLVPHTNLKD